MNTMDWPKVIQFIKEREPVSVSAGLLQDWFWTAATVYEDGEWLGKDNAYVTSYWATPGIKAEMPNGDTIEKSFPRKQSEEEQEFYAKKREQELQEMREWVEDKKSEGKL